MIINGAPFHFAGFCPYCVEAAQKSVLTVGRGSSSSPDPVSPFYDEDGKWHAHDQATHSTDYSCSKGHKFRVSEQRRCPSCDFGCAPVMVKL